jgi:hypothetical protein
MDNQVYEEKLKHIAELQKELRNREILSKYATETAQNTPEGIVAKNAYEAMKATKEELEFLINDLKEIAVNDFKITKTKPETKGLVLKIFKKIKYNKDEVKPWIEKNLQAAMVIDWKMFESFAENAQKNSPVPGVVFEEDPKAQIASDLSFYIS